MLASLKVASLTFYTRFSSDSAVHIELNPKTVPEGTDVTILCCVQGQIPLDMDLNFTPEYTGLNWTNISMLIKFDGDQNEEITYGWKIKDARKHHTGKYKCAAETSDGVSSSEAVHLIIKCMLLKLFMFLIFICSSEGNEEQSSAFVCFFNSELI